MAGPLPGPILDLIRHAADIPRLMECLDAELLRRFVADRDAAAFGEIVRRHGPVVLDVCRGLLRSEADVEDAFQATFLVLARKAASIRKGDALASWLHGVAYRAGQRARTEFARRHMPSPPPDRPAPPSPDDLSWREVRGVLHEELSRLPERLRGPLVLCYLEGMTRDRAAAALGLPKGTLKGRLERGRALLHARLVRRGVGPAAVLAVSVWPVMATAGVPPALADPVVRVATAVAAGAATPPVPASVAVLTQGVLKTMFQTRLRIAAGLLLIVGAIGLGAGFLIDRTQAAAVPENPKADKPEHPLSGTWAYVSIEGRVVDRKPGVSIFEGEREMRTFEIGKDGTGKVTQETRGADGKVSKTGTFDITVEAEKDPPRLTLQTTHADKYKIRYIYEVNKDTLKMCFYALGAVDGVELVAWPTGFDLDKQDLTKYPTLHVFKRVSPK